AVRPAEVERVGDLVQVGPGHHVARGQLGPRELRQCGLDGPQPARRSVTGPAGADHARRADRQRAPTDLAHPRSWVSGPRFRLVRPAPDERSGREAGARQTGPSRPGAQPLVTTGSSAPVRTSKMNAPSSTSAGISSHSRMRTRSFLSVAIWSVVERNSQPMASTPLASDTLARVSASVRPVIAQSVCWTTQIRRAWSRLVARIRERRASLVTRAPALRMILASPGARPSM